MRSFITIVALASIAFECVLGLGIGRLLTGISKGVSKGISKPKNPVKTPTKGPATQPAKPQALVVKLQIRNQPQPASVIQPTNQRAKANQGAADEKIHTGDDPADEESDDLYEETEEEAGAEGKSKNLFEAVIAGAQKDGTELTEDSFAIDKEKILAKTNGKNETKYSEVTETNRTNLSLVASNNIQYTNDIM
ncbi:hypothetical protein DSO57_1032340 [Entomophthora muscae]|uniref:Uncharacterized protein n=1 Tax=Entomophthora muscae TaxID=34485 RepID=A0ACC2SPL2_9FUNG|nr:hypothetical protein DSO57_1032340 [Entomophthora muscae]